MKLAASIWMFTIILLPNGSGGLEMLGIDGPTWVTSGDTVDLVVKYDVGRDAIYSVKWYKDDNEIWRYVPSDTPSFKTFPVEGIEILQSSRPHKLVLKIKGPKGSGRYKCEISVEAPTFFTRSSLHNLTVVVAPPEAPVISGGKEYYSVGDLIMLNCTLRGSKPAAKLSWKLNGNPVGESDLTNRQSIVHEKSGLETSILGLRLRAGIQDFPGGVAKVSCDGDIAGGVWSTTQTKALSGGSFASFTSSSAGFQSCLHMNIILPVLMLPIIKLFYV